MNVTLYEKAENIRAFFNRIYAFLDDINLVYPGKNILLVSHGGVSIPVNCYFNRIPQDDDLLRLVLKNCEYSKYESTRKKKKILKDKILKSNTNINIDI